jgi:excisionase family DNA binding protein
MSRAECRQTLGTGREGGTFAVEEPHRSAAGETAVSRPLPAPGRALGAVPKLSDLAERPELVSSLLPAAAGALLAQIAPLQTALLARVLGGVGSPARVDRCISVQQAAERLGVSRGFIYKHKATLPFVRCVGNTIRCSEAGITAWLEDQQPSGYRDFR